VPTKNGYAPLQSLVDTDIDAQDKTVQMDTETSTPTDNVSLPNNSKKNSRVPPITVSGKSRAELLEWCKGHDIKNYRLKMTSIGINLFCNNIDDFKKLKGVMKEEKFDHFTHALASEREFRVILKGLFVMEKELLLNELKEAGITPCSIRQLTPRKLKCEDQAHYVLAFPVGTVKLSTLRQCRYLCHVVVQWDYYQPRRFGPTRCHNCNLFGHGKSQCSMKPKCPICAKDHTLETCPNVDDEGNLKEGFKFCCPNCGGEHPATYERCPKLTEYLHIQKRLATRNSARNSTKKPRQFVMRQDDFQELPKIHRNVLTNSIPTIKTARTQNAERFGNIPPNAEPSDLMSFDEMMQLAKELAIALRQCQSREDQFAAITAVAYKFYGNYGYP
jgi:hypothetical protein